MPRTITIYLSYAPAERQAAETLSEHLVPLVEEWDIDIKDPAQVIAGDPLAMAQGWRRGADLLVLLLSKSYMASPAWRDAEEELGRGVIVIPVPIRDCLWTMTSALGGKQPVPRDGPPILTRGTEQRDSAWVEVCLAIAARIGQLPHAARRVRWPAAHTTRLQPLWSDPPGPDRLALTKDGETEPLVRCFPQQAECHIGRRPEWEGGHNDLTLPDPRASRHAAVIHRRGGRLYIKNVSRTLPLGVGDDTLAEGEERPLYHGQSLGLHPYAGHFYDGRYSFIGIPAYIDRTSGLLSLAGLTRVCIQFLAGPSPWRELRLLLAPDEEQAVTLALEVHRRLRSAPVAREGRAVFVLVPPGDELDLTSIPGLLRSHRQQLAVDVAPTTDTLSAALRSLLDDQPR